MGENLIVEFLIKRNFVVVYGEYVNNVDVINVLKLQLPLLPTIKIIGIGNDVGSINSILGSDSL